MPDKMAEVRRQRKSFSQFVSEKSKAAGASFAALHFPSVERLVRICRGAGDYNWSPGIAVIGKLVR